MATYLYVRGTELIVSQAEAERKVLHGEWYECSKEHFLNKKYPEPVHIFHPRIIKEKENKK